MPYLYGEVRSGLRVEEEGRRKTGGESREEQAGIELLLEHQRIAEWCGNGPSPIPTLYLEFKLH